MKYQELLEAQKKYGTTIEDILKKDNFDQVLDNVVLSPWWGVEIFKSHDFQINKINDKLYNLKNNSIEFSFIQLKLVGAPAIIDYILRLGVTKCKNLLFIGSVGSLTNDISIGDIVVPKYSICGDGASRYLNSDLSDDFGNIYEPNKELTDILIKTINQTIEEKIKFHNVPNFSTDTVFAQFSHIDKIKKLGAKVIEMETSSLFKTAKIVDINATALFCVSDNTVEKKSLYSGRTQEELDYRHRTRMEVVPKIIVEFLIKLK